MKPYQSGWSSAQRKMWMRRDSDKRPQFWNVVMADLSDGEGYAPGSERVVKRNLSEVTATELEWRLSRANPRMSYWMRRVSL